MKNILPVLALSGLLLASCGPAPITNSNSAPANLNVNTAPANVNLNVNMSGATMNQNDNDTIRVTSPAANGTVQSPVQVSGQAAGWYFEASLGLRVIDDNGKQLFQGGIMATDDWMTTAFVPFAGTVNYTTPSSKTGKFIFEKANPSGLPEHEQSFEVPVTFGEAL